MSHVPEEHRELILRCQSGDQPAMTELIKLYQNAILGLVTSIMGSRSLSEDIAQETFLRVLNSIESYQFKAPFKSWIFRIAVNLCRDELRKKKVRKIVTHFQTDDPEQTWEPIDLAPNIHDDYVQKEGLLKIFELVEQLPDPLRVVFVLRDIQDFSYEEIAKTVNWRIGTVKSRLFRARQILAKKYITKGV